MTPENTAEPTEIVPESIETPEEPFHHIVSGCFVGLFVPVPMLQQISDYQEALFDHLPSDVKAHLAWVPAGWLTIPLAYVGAVPGPVVEVVADITKRVFQGFAEVVTLKTKGLVTTHDAEGVPRVLSIGFHNEDLLDLQQRLMGALREAGLTIAGLPQLRITLARVQGEAIPPFMGHIESFTSDHLPESLEVSRVYVATTGEQGFSEPPRMADTFLLRESVSPCAGCRSLPEMLPHDADADTIIDDVVRCTGVNHARTLELLQREIENPSILQQSATLHEEEEPTEGITSSMVQDTLRGESREWEAVRALKGTGANNKVIKSMERQKERLEHSTLKKQGDAPHTAAGDSDHTKPEQGTPEGENPGQPSPRQDASHNAGAEPQTTTTE